MKSILTFVIIISLNLIVGCSENSVKPDPIPELETPADSISGIYFLHGTKVELEYAFPWPDWGGEEIILASDTSEIAFTVNIEWIKEKQDTIRFWGLMGANARETESVFPLTCYETFHCKAYAKLTGNELQIAIENTGPHYEGYGMLENGAIQLTGHYEYREVGIDYDLEGVKVDEE